MPQPLFDRIEKRGTSRPACRPRVEARHCTSSAPGEHRSTPSRNTAGGGRRLTTRYASCGKSKKKPGCTTTSRRSSRSRTMSSSLRVAGTRRTADQPPSAGSASTPASAHSARAACRSWPGCARGSARGRPPRRHEPGRRKLDGCRNREVRVADQFEPIHGLGQQVVRPRGREPSELDLRQAGGFRQSAEPEGQGAGAGEWESGSNMRSVNG
jgi:hypothetical protein